MSRNQAESKSPQICGGFVARHDKPALARGALKSPSNENKRQLSLELPTPDSLLGAEHAKLKRYERQERREQRRIRRRFLCLDCRFDTLDEHYYMVSDELWAATGLGPHDGMLCLYCLEQRIGRRLVFADFTALVPSACAWQAYAATRSRSAL